MPGLSASDILTIWESGRAMRGDDATRALRILRVALNQPTDELATLTIGQRDARLMDVRAQTFGQTLDAYAECPQCHAPLEFTTDLANLRAPTSPSDASSTFEMRVADCALQVRLPTTRDLALIANLDADAARRALIERCVLTARRAENAIAPGALDESIISQVAARMSELDPQADVVLDLDCPACRHHWQTLFDIAAFFWIEIAAYAKRLVCQVDALARAYGWREVDILNMGAARREMYLELIGA